MNKPHVLSVTDFGPGLLRDYSPVRPVPRKDTNTNPSPVEPVIRNTYFADLFRTWVSREQFDYDPNLHEALRGLLSKFVSKYATVQMIVDDFVKSREHVGIELDFAADSFKHMCDEILAVQMNIEICTTLGLVGHEESIALRELDKIFGIAKQEAVEQNIRARRADDDRAWQRDAVAGIHNMLRQIAIGMHRTVPAPKDSIFQRSRTTSKNAAEPTE